MQNRLISGLEQSENLGSTLDVLKDYSRKVYREYENQKSISEEELQEEVEKLNDDFRKLSADTLTMLINKLMMAWHYLYGFTNQLDDYINAVEATANAAVIVEILGKQLLEARRILGLAFTLQSQVAEKLENGNDCSNQIDSIYTQTYKKRFCEKIILPDDLASIPSQIDIEKEQYNLSIRNLSTVLKNVGQVSGMMRYIHGDENRNVKSKDGKTIESLSKRLADIETAEISWSEKQERLENAVWEMAWLVRKDQGFRDSRLANVLEDFINADNGLGLQKKYRITFPHNVKNYLKPLDLQKIRENQGDKPENILARMKLRLDLSYLKTKKGTSIADLMYSLENSCENKVEDEKEKVEQIVYEISEAWQNVQKVADNKLFFKQSNYADELKALMKDEFNLSVQKTKHLQPKHEMVNLAKPGA